MTSLSVVGLAAMSWPSCQTAINHVLGQFPPTPPNCLFETSNVGHLLMPYHSLKVSPDEVVHWGCVRGLRHPFVLVDEPHATLHEAAGGPRRVRGRGILMESVTAILIQPPGIFPEEWLQDMFDVINTVDLGPLLNEMKARLPSKAHSSPDHDTGRV